MILTPTEVYDLSGQTVDDDDIRLASAIVETCGDLDLSDGFLTRYTAADQARIRRAVVWQLRYLDANPDVLAAQTGVSQASANGASITFAGDAADRLFAPLAARTLLGLSWVVGASPVTVRTLRPTVQAESNRGPQPDPWRTIG